MARPPCGEEVLLSAQQQLSTETDVNVLRTLQAVVFPLLYGMSTEETAQAVGRSPRWVTSARNGYIRQQGITKKITGRKRNHAHMSITEEESFLAPFLESARCGGVLVVGEIHRALQTHLGCEVALATAYNLLHRHGWRKLAPDKRNVAADAQAQEEWEKNFGDDFSKLKKHGKGQGRSG
ncbi:MAG: winged helix-turn-helix domain-containing protein [Desulfovibrio sp.]|jgi:transposase|nr:winged helix-turn-helix domain-containing protein [Desulfovibrio sp.]